MRKREDVLANKRAAERRGRRSETWAAMFLMAKGYRILGRRVRTHAGEIDLVSLPPFGPVCIVEVKTRAPGRDATEAVGPVQWTRIARAACLYLASRPQLQGRGARFDVITVAGFRGISRMCGGLMIKGAGTWR